MREDGEDTFWIPLALALAMMVAAIVGGMLGVFRS